MSTTVKNESDYAILSLITHFMQIFYTYDLFASKYHFTHAALVIGVTVAAVSHWIFHLSYRIQIFVMDFVSATHFSHDCSVCYPWKWRVPVPMREHILVAQCNRHTHIHRFIYIFLNLSAYPHKIMIVIQEHNVSHSSVAAKMRKMKNKAWNVPNSVEWAAKEVEKVEKRKTESDIKLLKIFSLYNVSRV